VLDYNYHTHSLFCDGQRSPEQYVHEAIELGMSQIGFSSHAPMPFATAWSMKNDELLIYSKTIKQLQKAYWNKIRVWLSLEVDYIPGVTKPVSWFREETSADFIIGAVHMVANPEKEVRSSRDLWFIDGPFEGYEEGLNNVFGGNIHLAVEAYFAQMIEMIRTQKPDVVAHIDKVRMNNKQRFFFEGDGWYLDLVKETLHAVKEAGSILEVNTRGLYRKKCRSYFPSVDILQMAYQLEIPVLVSSDAHQPSELLGYFREAAEDLQSIGYTTVKKFVDDSWTDYPIA
jgi:histidinol-phosphatase (PHP family)